MTRPFILALLVSTSAFAVFSASAQTAPAPADAGERTNTPAEVPGITANPQGPSAKASGDSAAPTPSTANAVRASAAPNDAAATADIVVTGSRLVTNGNNSPTPVTVLPTEQFLKLQPTTVTEAVNLLPALQGSQNTTSRPGGSQRNGAGAYFNLRNMGNLRTLVLYDGNRLIPTINQNEGDTDASIIPQLLLKRVDVVTGGVSAVYGSDAISGVINFVTDRDFNGIKIQASNGVSTYGDDNVKDIGIAAGTKFADGRGHIEASFQRHDDPGILVRSTANRPFFDRQTGAGGNGTTVPYFNFDNQLQSNMTYGGLIVNAAGNGALRDLMFTPSGQLTPFVHGLIPTANGLIQGTTANASTGVPTNTESGGSGVYNLRTSLKAGIRFNQAFGRVDYDLTDTIHAFAQLGYSDVHTFNNYQSPNLTGLRVSYGNPFLASVQQPYQATIQALAANPNNVFTFGRFILNDPRADQYTKSYVGLAGLEGKFGDYRWNVNYGRSQSIVRAVNQVNIDNGHLFAALDAVRSPTTGQTVCRASLTNANYAGCVPINLFGDGQASQQALDYIYRQTFNRNRTRMDDVNGSITGKPFSTWAGPVSMALSGEYRRLRWDVTSNATPNDLADCSGIGTGVTGGLNCTQGRTLQWFYNTMSPLATVHQDVTEGAFEAEVPLLKDLPLVEALSVTGAVRYTHYNTSGNAVTWKVGGDWQVTDDLRLRATRSRDIRAPNLFELYSPTQRNPTIAINNDPLLINGAPATANGTVITNVQTANPNLTPEKANTFTVGAVYRPHFLPHFSVSLDYFKIDVNQAIFLLQGFSLPVLRLCAGAAPPDFCSSFVTRNSTGAITQTLSTYLNIASFKTEGVDGEANYSMKVLNRPLTLRGLVSWQPKLTFDQGPAGVLKAAGTFNTGSNRIAAAPKWKVTGIVSYDVTENVTVTVLERWRSHLRANADPTLLFAQPNLPSLGYTTLNISYAKDTPQGRFELFGNVVNLFNKFPKVYYTGTQNGLNQGLPEGDDPIGRYFTVGARWKW